MSVFDNSKFVHSGGCFVANELVHCALEESHCQGMEFKSQRQLALQQQQGDGRSVERCMRPHPDLLGMCTSSIDNMHCTGHASNCAIGPLFVQTVPFCTLKYNHFADRKAPVSLYGTCTPVTTGFGIGETEPTCVWSIDSCPNIPSQNSFKPGSFTRDIPIEDMCTCDKVKVGACVHGGIYSCAVSPNACDYESDFKNWWQLQEENKECRLCESFDKNAPVPIGRQNSYGRLESPSSLDGKTCKAVVGISLGSIFLALFVGGVAYCLVRRCSCRDGNNQKPIETADNSVI